jgi:hypothetical protein
MDRFSVVKKQLNRTPQVISLQNWVENYICGTQKPQNVVGNRQDDLGLSVTQLMFDNKNRWAHVCPYVRDALDYDHVWVEESDLDGGNPADIENLLLHHIQNFKNTPPSYDPTLNGQPAFLPVLWKTFIIFFPNILRKPRNGRFPLIDDIYTKLISTFVQEGLMFGGFYPVCPITGIYNTAWNNPFVCPFPAFAIRYLIQQDHLFLNQNSPEWSIYRSYFPPRDSPSVST